MFLGLWTSITNKYFVLFTPDSVGGVCVCGKCALVSLGSMSADALASPSVMNGRQWTGNLNIRNLAYATQTIGTHVITHEEWEEV